MKCLRCGEELLPIVELSVRMGGPQICGLCIDADDGEDGIGLSPHPIGFRIVHSPICPRCGFSRHPRFFRCECEDEQQTT